MKYLRGFRSLNEGKSLWRDFLIAGLLIVGIGEIKTSYNKWRSVKKLREVIDSPSSLPSSRESNIIDSIRLSLIEDIETSPKWRELGREEIIDSIREIKFLVVDSTTYWEITQSSACFINMTSLWSKLRSEVKIFLPKGGWRDVIIIRGDMIGNENLSNIIIHEVYHYVDKLIGLEWEFSNFIDGRALSNGEWLDAKIWGVFRGRTRLSHLKRVDKNLSRELSPLSSWYRDKFNYLSSPDEIFARWWTLKGDMMKRGIITNIEDRVDLGDIDKYLLVNSDDSQWDILIVLDWEKLEEFQDYMENWSK